MSRIVFIVLLGLTALPADSLAQGERSQQERACGGDVRKLCRKVMDQGDSAIHRCLREHQSKLSSRCRKVIEQGG